MASEYGEPLRLLSLLRPGTPCGLLRSWTFRKLVPAMLETKSTNPSTDINSRCQSGERGYVCVAGARCNGSAERSRVQSYP